MFPILTFTIHNTFIKCSLINVFYETLITYSPYLLEVIFWHCISNIFLYLFQDLKSRKELTSKLFQ